jgi:hypothetical protein
MQWCFVLCFFASLLAVATTCAPCKRQCDGDVCTESGFCSVESGPTSPPPDAGDAGQEGDAASDG